MRARKVKLKMLLFWWGVSKRQNVSPVYRPAESTRLLLFSLPPGRICQTASFVSTNITLISNTYIKRNLRAYNLKSISLDRGKVVPRRGTLARPAEQNAKA